MRIGLFGGTFDPPHLGHLILASECLHQLSLDRVFWILTPNPPHKQGKTISPLGDRLAMLEAALGDDPAFTISRVEIDRPAPHYAVDTVQILKTQFPGDLLFYLLGGDSLRDLPTWHNPQHFVAACDGIGVMHRPGAAIDLTALDVVLPGLMDKVHFLETPLVEISAQDIRCRISQGLPYRYFLPPPVYTWIQSHDIYRQNS
ncbi:MAG TPA: nicotinate-nucleotide adenylyltransferase [Anaerolineaceae bacterium]|nr:nicotinate-nucleotide adenylyltransferase [Longilinea sp.]HOD44209.1 nicotinate-nucleotide adenylyltransferase [Anaerolineaceae bacterium]HPA33364.1 nicotinate-nucleotide adenylyltransferase [Anaerolineaceae bacterium]